MPISLFSIVRLACIASIGIASAGCSSIKPVQPWEKGNLAKPEMTFTSNSLEAKFSAHVYDSREGASGGSSVGGGGCGCN